MAWDAKAFMAEYLKDECQNTRCANRRDQADETRRRLAEYESLIRMIQQRAKEGTPSAAREIYVAVSNFNLGHPLSGSELPRMRGQ